MKKNLQLLVIINLLLFISGCSQGSPLKNVCPKFCTYVPGTGIIAETQFSPEDLKGTCAYGTTVCDENFNIIECVGEIRPTRISNHSYSIFGWDDCGGGDTDCDGEVDEDCCHPTPETCNGKDDDCNGLIDDNVLTQCTDLVGNPVSCICYEGPIGSEQFGQCKAGYYECVNGNFVCTGQTLPTQEICNGLDENCNGTADEGLPLKPVDILVIIDSSGSMCTFIEAMICMLNNISTYLSTGQYRFALMDIATSNYYSYETKQIMDFGTFNEFIDQLDLVSCLNYLGNEASLDGLLEAVSPTSIYSFDPNHVGIVVLITDEPPQSYTNPWTTEQDIIDAATISERPVFIWSRQFNGFIDIADQTGGKHFSLSSDCTDMSSNLSELNHNLCSTNN